MLFYTLQWQKIYFYVDLHLRDRDITAAIYRLSIAVEETERERERERAPQKNMLVHIELKRVE